MKDPVSEDVSALWERVRGDLRSSLPASTFKLWLEPLRIVTVQGETLYLTAPDSVRAWVERRYERTLTEALRRRAGDRAEIVLVAPGKLPDGATSPTEELDPRGSFDDFVLGAGNRFAHAAALAVAEMPGEAYNPLFLHGAPGLGKTHLLWAIAAYIRRRHPERTIFYTTAERFTADFVASVRGGGGTERFKRRHREVDVLLVDDVQFLEHKRQTEEEFFHTFNSLHAEGSQIVLSSDRPPAEIERIAERLRDRFEWGLCAQLGPPDLPTRMTLLTRLAREAASEPPDDEVLKEIASRVPANVRKLEGALNRVLAFASMMDLPLTPDLVRDVLDPVPAGSHSAAGDDVTLGGIQGAVCAVLHLSHDDLLGRKRSAHAVRGRQLAIHLARERLGLSLGELARAFDRDRATILHSLRAVERDLVPDSQTSADLEQVHRRLEMSTV